MSDYDFVKESRLNPYKRKLERISRYKKQSEKLGGQK